MNDKKELYPIRITKEKTKLGKVDRITDSTNIIGKDLFKKETNPDVFIGQRIKLKS